MPESIPLALRYLALPKVPKPEFPLLQSWFERVKARHPTPPQHIRRGFPPDQEEFRIQNILIPECLTCLAESGSRHRDDTSTNGAENPLLRTDIAGAALGCRMEHLRPEYTQCGRCENYDLVTAVLSDCLARDFTNEPGGPHLLSLRSRSPWVSPRSHRPFVCRRSDVGNAEHQQPRAGRVILRHVAGLLSPTVSTRRSRVKDPGCPQLRNGSFFLAHPSMNKGIRLRLTDGYPAGSEPGSPWYESTIGLAEIVAGFGVLHPLCGPVFSPGGAMF